MDITIRNDNLLTVNKIKIGKIVTFKQDFFPILRKNPILNRPARDLKEILRANYTLSLSNLCLWFSVAKIKGTVGVNRMQRFLQGLHFSSL